MLAHNGRTKLLCMSTVVFIVLAIITAPKPAWAAYEAFLEIEGIPGESLDPRHKDQIDILSWSLGVSVPAVPKSSAPGSAAGKTIERDFRFTMKVNRASTILFLKCAERQSIGKATLHIRSAGVGSGQDYLTITLSNNVMVSSFHTTGAKKSPDDRPIDDISLSFGKIEIDYKRIKPNGTLDESSKPIVHDFVKTTGK